jgi:hypothetical protein
LITCFASENDLTNTRLHRLTCSVFLDRDIK